MQNSRRKFLKTAAGLSVALPLMPALTACGGVASSAMSSGLVQNGSIITAAHWGILKLTIENGRVVKSEPWQKFQKTDNPLWYYTQDMIYKSRVRHAYVRKSYLANPDKPKPELRGKEEFVQVPYEDAIKLAAKELLKRANKRATTPFALEVMAGNPQATFTTLACFCTAL